MKYEVVQLGEKKVAGIRIRTQNDDADMSNQIGMAWQRFFEGGIYASIPNKLNNKTMGLYTNYENGVSGKYDVMVCCEISTLEQLPNALETETIPQGKYAKFVIQGHVQRAVQAFWTELWTMDLDRRYGCDFEEYQGGDDMEHAEIHVYISLN